MTLTKKKMVREIGRRTRLTNREVQEVVEILVAVWSEALIEGEKIEIENFFVLEVLEIKYNDNMDLFKGFSDKPKVMSRLVIRASRNLKTLLKKY